MGIILKKSGGALVQPTVNESAKSVGKKQGALSFMKTGQAAKEAFDKEEHKAELANKNTARRFWIPNGGNTSITFLDGILKAGIFDNPSWYEHYVSMAGKPNWFMCLHEQESCPICEGSNRYGYITAFSIIDHSEYKNKEGKQVKDQKRLFIAKRGTLKILQKAAEKRGGLRGVRFDVSRTGDKEAGVGNVFDFDSKATEAELKAAYGGKDGVGHLPFDYAKVVDDMFMPADELRKLGFGAQGIGSEPEPESSESYEKDL